jgi:shikimate kinase/3-dehydroquinate synthase
MGSGKSSVGAVVAAHLGWRFVDLDARIAEEQGASVREIFERRGEAWFRALERDAALRTLAERSDQVIALGGGTVVDRGTRRALLERAFVVTLRAPAAVLASRLAHAHDRPLLAGRDALDVLGAILEERREAYAECHAEIDTHDRDVDAIADDVIARARDRAIVVPLGVRTYRVEIGAGIAARVGERARELAITQAVVVCDANVEEPHARRARELLTQAGVRVIAVRLPAGEAHKTIASVERIWDAALEGGVDRAGAVVAVGGGVVGDLAGFAASTLLRGVALIQVPTTLLAMVDSSVGGKTGFDRAQGKNLVGTFHQPSAVLCDVDALATLPREEIVSGLAEVVKSAWIDGEEAVRALERDAAAILAGDRSATIAAIRAAIALKARIVSEDERESGSRALLNLGHTIGHAIEAASGYSMRHGEAVALGMVAAMRVARSLGHAVDGDLARLQALLDALSLPRDPERYVDARALAFVGSDKKRRGGALRFVLPGAPGRVELRTIALDEVLRLAAGGV